MAVPSAAAETTASTTSASCAVGARTAAATTVAAAARAVHHARARLPRRAGTRLLMVRVPMERVPMERVLTGGRLHERSGCERPRLRKPTRDASRPTLSERCGPPRTRRGARRTRASLTLTLTLTLTPAPASRSPRVNARCAAIVAPLTCSPVLPAPLHTSAGRIGTRQLIRGPLARPGEEVSQPSK